MPYRDYEEFIAALNAHEARYLIVGAHAVALHARPRATKDLDVLIEPTTANASRVLAALASFFGDVDLGYTENDILDPDTVIQLGVAPVRIDLISELTGAPDFDAAWDRRAEARFGSVEARYLGLDDLIASKEAVGRAQDIADVEVLRRARRRAGGG